MQDNKDNIAKEFKISENDNGSTPVQIALLTSRIERLTEHSKLNKHDYSSKRGLVTLVDQRRKLLSYLKNSDNSKYQDVIKSLGLRR
tara:strand:+ start:1236 stop:1496 length:261 start_codon:yes stop_codon:yes gene_type:complete